MKRKQLPPKPEQPPEDMVYAQHASKGTILINAKLMQKSAAYRLGSLPLPLWNKDPSYNWRKPRGRRS